MGIGLSTLAGWRAYAAASWNRAQSVNQNSTPSSPAREHPQRYHALDATRAFALLLGVVFHTVWFYTDFPFSTRVKDICAGPFYS